MALDCSACYYPNDNEVQFCVRCAAPLGVAVERLPQRPAVPQRPYNDDNHPAHEPKRRAEDLPADGPYNAPYHDRRARDGQPAHPAGIPGVGSQPLSGRYRLLRRLGSGGFGAVYEAENLSLGLRVAVKLLNRSGLSDARVLERFLDEARMVAQLRSPHVVVLHDYDVTETGAPYLVMELLRGRDVGSMLCEGVLSPRRALHIAAQVCSALGEAHTMGIVHRDVKPENVVLIHKGDDADFVKVVDFGVAKFCRGADTRASAVLGTPAYIAPEMLADEPLDGRTDLYALGIMLWEMIVGRLPFPGDNQAIMLSSHLHAPRRWPRVLDPKLRLHDGLEALLTSLVARDPQDRPRTAFALRAQLLELMPHAQVTPLPVPPPQGGPAWDPPPVQPPIP